MSGTAATKNDPIMQVPTKLPKHVSIIMDGNGRWAQERGKERIYGHFEGVNSVRAVMEAAVDWKIPYVSFFAFSEENWGRPEGEVNGLMELIGRAMIQELDNFKEHDIRFVVLGNLARLSDELNADIRKAMGDTRDNQGLTMILFLSYSGQWDILQAAEKMAHDLMNDPGRAVQPEDLSRHLVTAAAGIPDPDLLIRTSGEKRISNYLLWQTAYTEFVFSETLWPDFRREAFLEALEEFASRDRRFGKIK